MRKEACKGYVIASLSFIGLSKDEISLVIDTYAIELDKAYPIYTKNHKRRYDNISKASCGRLAIATMFKLGYKNGLVSRFSNIIAKMLKKMTLKEAEETYESDSYISSIKNK